MLADGVDSVGPTTWADLGCGDGTFTCALAELTAPGSVIHAVDLDRAVLRRIPSSQQNVRIIVHQRDFVREPLPLADLDGILMANSLHFVRDQAACVRRVEAHMKPRRRFLIVEYDTDLANRWVPYPVSQTALAALFESLGYASFRILASRPSLHRRAPLYAASIGS